jgi:dihydrofolate reductase
MARIRGYMGVSLDQYIASPDGTIDWLQRYDRADFGEFIYTEFIRTIRTVVMGRGTYEAVLGFNAGWPYEAQRSIVVTSKPVESPPGEIEIWTAGIPGLIAHLRALDDGDVWIVGGGQLQQAIIAEGGLDILELYVVPEIVGDGVPLFPPNGFQRRVTLASVDRLGSGIVRMVYDFAPMAEAG